MKKRILCFGDSNTWGAVPGENTRHAGDVRWTGVLQKELGDGYQILEEGYNGRTTVFHDPVENRLSGIAYFGPCLDTCSPLDLIILMLGTNDLKKRFGADARTIAYGLQRYLNVLDQTPMAGTKPKVLLMAPPEIDSSYRNHELFYDMFGEDADRRSQKFADAYREFADLNGISFLNAAEYGKASDRDGIHMGEKSHAALGKAVAEKVLEILG